MKYIKLFENFDWIEDDFDEEEYEEINTDKKYLYPSLSNVFRVIKTILIKTFNVEIYLSDVSKSLNELGLDQLDEVELVMTIENEIDISIPDEKVDIDNLTIRKLILIVNEILKSKHNENFDFNDDDFDYEEEDDMDNSEIIDYLINRDISVIFKNKDTDKLNKFLKDNNVTWRDTGRDNFDFEGGWIKLIKFGKFNKHDRLKNLEGNYYIEIGKWDNIIIKFDKLFDIDIEKNIIR